MREHGLQALPWTRDLRQWQARVLCLRQHLDADDWPDVTDDHLLQTVEDWLQPFLATGAGLRRLDDIDLRTPLTCLLDHEHQARLDQLAPTHLQVPSGARIRLDYTDGDVPVLPVRVQQMFGATRTPCIAGGRVNVLVHLLSPAHRPVQVTTDLASFWANTYAVVRKELRGRYPKHAWPEDPLSATPTNTTRHRR